MFGIKFVGFPDNHIQNITFKILADISDIGIFLLPDTVINISPKNPISVRS